VSRFAATAARSAAALLLLVPGLAACNGDSESEWLQWNADDDQIQVEVGVAELLDEVEIPLRSSTGEVDVGIARVDPAGGPVGTLHDIVIIIDDDYADAVDRASIRTDSGDRGTDEYDLARDSAEEGVYKLTIESDGAPDEVRTDTFTFRLWEEVVAAEDEESSTEDEGA
jgi:hypothetical protein